MTVPVNGDHSHIGEKGCPVLSRPYFLTIVADWGGANFHRISSWLTQEFCDLAGPPSRTSILSLRDGGMDALLQVANGEADLAIATPATLMKKALTGDAPFPKAMPHLRTLAVLPQNDRMVLALDPKYDIKSMDELRSKKPALRLATSTDDGTNFIGHVARRFLEAHGVSEATLKSWGGETITAHRPEQTVAFVENGQADALLQEAIMTPWWRGLIESKKVVPLAAEPEALRKLEADLGLGDNPLPAGYWDQLDHDLPALDFSDFVVVVRSDMPAEVAYALTWCLVETRHLIEAQFRHIPPQRSPLSYPLDPKAMARPPVPLHPAAQEYYHRAGHL